MNIFRSKAFKIINAAIDVVLVVLVLSFLLVVCMQRFSNNRIAFFNYRMFTVVSGSMEPKYVIGDVLLAKEIDPKDVKVGDVISYLGYTGVFEEKVVTHQVVEIEQDKDGKLIFHTKGLANIVEDPIVYEDQLYGRVERRVETLSFIFKAVKTPLGMFLLVGLPIMYIVGSETLAYMIRNEDKRREEMRRRRRREREEEEEDDDDDEYDEEDEDEVDDDDDDEDELEDEEDDVKKKTAKKTTRNSISTSEKKSSKSTSSQARKKTSSTSTKKSTTSSKGTAKTKSTTKSSKKTDK